MRIEIASTIETLQAENTGLDEEIEAALLQLENMQAALDDPALNSAAYEALASRTELLRIPVAKAHCIVFERIIEANLANISQLESLPESSPGVLDTAEIQKHIDEFEDQNRLIKSTQSELMSKDSANGSLFNSYDNMLRMNEHIIELLRQQQQCAYDYDNASASLYSAAEQAVSNILKGSTASVAHYLDSGNCHPLFWTLHLEESFAQALANGNDRIKMQYTKENPGEMCLSEDYKFIFYKGRRWNIVSPYNEELSPGFRPGYHTVDELFYTYEEFNIAYVFAHFGTTSGGVSHAESGMEIDRRRAARYNTVDLASSTMQNVSDAHEKHVITFRFEENSAGEERVNILIKDERFIGTHTGNFTKDLYMHYADDEGTSLWPSFFFNIKAEFDPAREDDGLFGKICYFNGKGELEFSFRHFPKDKITLYEPGGQIDYTDEFFRNSQDNVGPYYQEKIMGLIE